MKNSVSKQMSYDTDIMRIISAFFVILIHCSNFNSPAEIFYNTLSRFSVPVFVIISGYYMLDRNINSKHLIKKCIKLFFYVILWAGIYYIYDLLFQHNVYSGFKDIVKYLFTEPIHLWYLYAVITLYILTPPLKVFHDNASKKEYHYALWLCFIFGSVIKILLNSKAFPIMDTVIDKMKMPHTLGFVFLYLLGAYLKKYELSKKQIGFTYVFAVLGTIPAIAGTILLSKTSYPVDLLSSFFSPNAIIAGAGFFILIKQICARYPLKNQTVYRYINNVSRCTFGVYLLHPLIILLVQDYFGDIFSFMAPVLAIPLKALTIFVITMIIVCLYKKLTSLIFDSKTKGVQN